MRKDNWHPADASSTFAAEGPFSNSDRRFSNRAGLTSIAGARTGRRAAVDQAATGWLAGSGGEGIVDGGNPLLAGPCIDFEDCDKYAGYQGIRASYFGLV
jgi:hypothetical protein